MEENKLTGQGFWEEYWDDKPGNKKAARTSLLIKEILSAFDAYLPRKEGLSLLEIGGASGEYLIYLTRKFRYSAHSLDYSHLGNVRTLETFQKAGMEVQVYERDLFADNSDLPKFDIVYSLGFIEHFDNPGEVVRCHLDLLKPGGILMLGVPNYGGIYRFVLKRMAPSIGQTHNLKTMDLKNWSVFEQDFPISTVFKGYIGGFEPLNMKKMEADTLLNRLIYFKIRVLMTLFSFHFRWLRKFNSRLWSGYLLGIYRKKA